MRADCQPCFLASPVVEPTGRDSVVDPGGAAFGVVDDVVDLAPMRRHRAAREGAAGAIRGDHGQSLLFGVEPLDAAVRGDAFRLVDDDVHEPVIAGCDAHGLGNGDKRAVASRRHPATRLERLLGHRHDDGSCHAADRWEPLGTKVEPEGVEQGVVAALPGGSRVF